MTKVTLAAAALNQTPLDWRGNRERILAAANAARDAHIVCFPELCISGYGCEDLFLAPWVREASLQSLIELLAAPELRGGAVYLIGLPLEISGKVYSAVAVIQSGKLLGITCKKNLVGDGIHYEPRWFHPWPVGLQEECALLGLPRCPIGDVWYEFDGISVGLEICHDAWVEERHSKQLAERGVQIICNPSASHFAFGKRAVREQLVRAASRDHCEVYLYANLLGCEAGRALYDGDRIIAQQGTVVASGERLLLGDFAITSATVDVQATRQHGVGFFGARRHPPVRGAGFAHHAAPITVPSRAEGWEATSGEELTFEEFSRAVSLGLFDYGRKSRTLKFALSLSGGADSAACAVLVDLMRKRMEKELPAARIAELTGHTSTPLTTQQLLICAYQATKQSSNATLQSARAVSQAVGISLHEWDVEPLVEAYRTLTEKSLGRAAAWETDDLALQNIQSRVRSPSIWLLANLHGALLLTTANRSEAAVGYATMDGDTSGGLAPLGGIDKHFIRAWLRWMQVSGPATLGKYPLLESVNTLEPTAELRPGGTQTDEGDLMPYEILAALERAAVRYYRSPEEAGAMLEKNFAQKYSSTDLLRWRDRFFTLFFRSQWKRERFAPSFHLDDFSLDPKTWLRMPILSKRSP